MVPTTLAIWNGDRFHAFSWTINEDSKMVTFREMKVQQILADGTLSTERKIEKLRDIETEVRGMQRAATEGPMNPNDGWDNELREVRKALESLGAEKPRKGAATL